MRPRWRRRFARGGTVPRTRPDPDSIPIRLNHTDVRPRLGQITHADGSETPVMFTETDEPGQFRVVTVEGLPVHIARGDSLHVDMLGPGQSVRVDTDGNWQS